MGLVNLAAETGTIIRVTLAAETGTYHVLQTKYIKTGVPPPPMLQAGPLGNGQLRNIKPNQASYSAVGDIPPRNICSV